MNEFLLNEQCGELEKRLKRAQSTLRKLREDHRRIKKALQRAVKNHGHDYNCSAARGMERDCHCGWLEIKQLVDSTKI